MYPPQTSLIPIAVALTRFLETNGLSTLFSWYPYWYTGVPFRYITGPIVPVVLFGLHKIFPLLDLFTLSYILIGISYLAGIIGWVKLVKKLLIFNFQFSIFNYCFFPFLLLVFPWRLFSSITMGETSFTVARNLLPWVLLSYHLYLKKEIKWGKVIPVFVTSLILLVSTDILPVLFIGFTSLALALSFWNGKIKGFLRRLKQIFLLFFISLLFVTLIWYTPGYWMTLAGNPSLGGLSLGRVVIRVMDLFRGFIPVLLAILAVYFSKKTNWNKLTIFTLSWTFSFLFITVYRFFADINFWMDWTSWFYELEIGLALFCAKTIYDIRFTIYKSSGFKLRTSNQFSVAPHIPYTIFHILLLILPFCFVWRINLALGKPRLISKTTPVGVQSIGKIAEIVGESRVFLSGSTVFWSEALGKPINQLRGGNDKTATNSLWYHGAYQIREGSVPAISRAWLDLYGIEYVLVHTQNSGEYYHDFKNINKWKNIGNLVWEENGDLLFKIENIFQSYIVDLNLLDGIKIPQKGDDIESLRSCLTPRKGGVVVKRSYNKITLSTVKLEDNEGILVLENYSNHWKVSNGSISKDIFGNILVRPDNFGDIVLTYK